MAVSYKLNIIFFFKQKTAYEMRISDWSSDVCSSDLLQSLNVRPVLDGEGQETGQFEVPAGGRRYRALELLVKQKRLAKTAAVPCIVKHADGDISAEENSYPENTYHKRSTEHTSELQSPMRISSAILCLKKKTTDQTMHSSTQ